MDSIKNLKRLKFLCKLFANLTMFVQILLILSVVVFYVYCFLHLLGSNAFSFMDSMVLQAKSFIQMLFGNSIKASLPNVDGELVAFIVVNIIAVILAVQLKMLLKTYGEEVDKKLVEEKAKVEVKFNKELADELHKSIVSYSSFMLGCSFNVVPLIAESMQVYGVEAIDTEKIKSEVVAKFLGAMKSLQGISVSKEGNDILMSSTNFDKVDLVIVAALDAFNRLKKEYREQKAVVKIRLALEAYRPDTSLKTVYASIKPLLDLNLGHEVLCYGNVKSRYDMLKNPTFTVSVKGKYDIHDNEETIYSLVKKS